MMMKCQFHWWRKPENPVKVTTDVRQVTDETFTHKNFDSLLQFIEPIIDRLHCIIITETWFQSQNVNLYNIQGFKATHNFRTKKRGGNLYKKLHYLYSNQNIKYFTF